MANKYQVILFDVNNTLLGYEDPWGFEKRFASACRDLGKEVTPQQVRQAILPLVPQWQARKKAGTRRASNAGQYREAMSWFYQGLLEGLQVPGDPAAQANGLYDRFIIAEGFMPAFTDAHGTLEALAARGFRLGVLSNYPPQLEDDLRRHGLHRFFSFFVVSSVVGMEKPDRAIFELAIERAGCPREEILYLGDDWLDDIQGARGVGLNAILVDRANHWQDVACTRITQLPQVVTLLDSGDI